MCSWFSVGCKLSFQAAASNQKHLCSFLSLAGETCKPLQSEKSGPHHGPSHTHWDFWKSHCYYWLGNESLSHATPPRKTLGVPNYRFKVSLLFSKNQSLITDFQCHLAITTNTGIKSYRDTQQCSPRAGWKRSGFTKDRWNPKYLEKAKHT